MTTHGERAGASAGAPARTRVVDGVVHVWSIMDNAWVTREYWDWLNGASRGRGEEVRG